MTLLKKLQKAKTIDDVANLLKIRKKFLTSNIYKRTNKYQNFTIPKKNGGERNILAPNKKLKIIQQRLSEFLYTCIKEINVEKKQVVHLSHGYRKDCSIYTNAIIHRKKRYVLNIDIEDFYDQINFGRVRGFFIKNDSFKLNERVATVLAQIAIYENKLPQGSPCSPVISNLIGHILDMNLSQLATENGCVYSRYCDDITFSTNLKKFPEKIAKQTNSNWVAGEALDKSIRRNGFQINPKKTRMQLCTSRQSVTGLTVNEKVNTPRQYRDDIRAMVYSLVTTGNFEFPVKYKKIKIEQAKEEYTYSKKLNSLFGMLCYINQIDKKNCEKIEQPRKNDKKIHNLTKREKTLRDFIVYTRFFNNQNITIICEGKTDIKHIRYYLKHRDKNGHPAPNLSIFPTSLDAPIFNLLSESGGSGNLKNLAQDYDDYCKKFHKPDNQKPVIILLDNDQGTRKIKNMLDNQRNFQRLDPSNEVYFCSKNLYIVFIQKINDKNTEIEDYYGNRILKTQHLGKSLNKTNKSCTNEQYGKEVFASTVIPKKINEINWEKFDPIFKSIQKVVDDFEQRKIKRPFHLRSIKQTHTKAS